MTNPGSESTLPRRSDGFAAASAISGHLDTRTAAFEVAEQLQDQIAGDCDLVFVFGSYHHRAALSEAGATIRRTLSPHALLGTTAEAVLGGDQERDGSAGLAAIAIRMPGARFKTWTTTPDDPFRLKDPAMMRERLGLEKDFRCAVMIADPFSTPVPRLLPALTSCGENQSVPIVGGMSSGGTQPGTNVLLLNEEARSVGGIGVSLFGDVSVNFVVSQGCRPIGKPLLVTKADQNVILQLGSKPAMQALKDIAESLSKKEKHLLSRGLLVGTVINEYKERFGRGDFLVRNVLGFQQKVDGIAVGDVPRVGQTIQFHVRDAETAAEDLQLLLDVQQLSTPPFAGLLFTCNGRGERLFGEPNHDLNLIQERLGQVPVAGFFAAGEIGPIGEKSFLHGHTASLALFRSNA